jgi:hypothetical protein
MRQSVHGSLEDQVHKEYLEAKKSVSRADSMPLEFKGFLTLGENLISSSSYAYRVFDP